MKLLVLMIASAAGHYGYGGKHQQNVIIMPAGLSKAHQWVGFGDYSPFYIPKPFVAPRWIPHVDDTYTASWVPHAPEPRHKQYQFSFESAGRHGGGIPSGFGHPKSTSVMAPSYKRSQPAISVQHVSSGGYQAPIHRSHAASHSSHHNRPLRSPQRLQVLDSYSEPSFESLLRIPIMTPRHVSSSGNHQAPSLHVGSPQPGAAPPAALGIDYSKPKPDDVINMLPTHSIRRYSSVKDISTMSNKLKDHTPHWFQSSYTPY